LVVMQFIMLGTIDILTISMSVMLVGIGIFLIGNYLNQKNKVKNHIKSYQGKTIAIQRIIKELQLTTAGFFKLLGEIKKSKDITFEIDDRTGELIVEEIDEFETQNDSIKIESIKSKKSGNKIENLNTCSKCGKTLDKGTEFCSSCGRKIE